jgi:glycosyltransferase 2 family protein
MEFLRRRLGLIFRSVVSILAVYWVYHTNDWHKVWLNVLTMDVRWLVAGAFCFLPTMLIVSARWRMLLGVHDVHMRFWKTIELTMIGQFFSTVGVGTTGGDVFKIFYVTRAVPQQKVAVGFSVVVDRIIGLFALLFFGVFLSVTKLHVLLSDRVTAQFTYTFYVFALVGLVASILACLGPLVLQNPRLRSLLAPLLEGRRRAALVSAYERSARAFGTNLLALLVSIPSHMSIILMGYCVLCAMNLPVDLLGFCAIIAIVNMLIALPVSISGIGVREYLFTHFFALLGIDATHAVIFSLTFFALNILWCLAGGPFYFLYRHETHTPPPDVAEVAPIFSQR